jgi:tRNA dimethylallyltransferase
LYHISSPILIVICGPTATGKTALAIALAQRLNGLILSADSRQVYREFDIGTAKPTPIERQQVHHELIDICDPTEVLTVADYQQQAQAWIEHCHHSHIVPLLVGGTGLYIKAIVRGLRIPRVPPHPDLRSQLQSLGQSHCYALLETLDPVATQAIHPHDQVRTLRALEVYYVTGKPMSDQQGEQPPDYPIVQIGLDCLQSGDVAPSPDRLTQRIQRRTQMMMEMGFLQEVDALCQRYGDDLPLLNTLGYQEMRQALRGDLSLQQAQDLTVLHTRQFAKRQRTWFRTDSTVHWFDADIPDLVDQVWAKLQLVLAHWDKPLSSSVDEMRHV